jgi:hypothetical protein
LDLVCGAELVGQDAPLACPVKVNLLLEMFSFYVVRCEIKYFICRQKFHSVESEATKGTEVLKDRLGSIKGKVQEALEEASRSDIAKKAGKPCILMVCE